MKRFIIACSLIFFPLTRAFCQQKCLSSNTILKALFKTCWRYKGNTSGEGTVFTYDDDEIREVTKNALCFNNDTVVMLRDTFINPTYSIRKVRKNDFMKENDLTAEDIDIKADSLVIIKISSKVLPSGYKNKNWDYNREFIFNGNKLYLMDGGITFHYVRFVKNVSRNAN